MAAQDHPNVITADLNRILKEISKHPSPFVPTPTGVKKRASVALIIRLKPQYAHWPETDPESQAGVAHQSDPSSRVEHLFEQDWVQWAEPEVLFIKRSTRKGDPWTGHVALPGGKRDDEDVDDRATAIRETAEEVGIDLSEENAIAVGNLPQRVVTSSWGKVALMVLCPYIFLLTRHDIPTLKLQPDEIASAHWVPLRALLSPNLRTYEYQDVSARMSMSHTRVERWFWRTMLGRMRFCAIRLLPSESSYVSSVPGFIPGDQQEPTSAKAGEMHRLLGFAPNGRSGEASPLHLWGLTLGVLSDFLDLFPPHNALELWRYPQFSAVDVRFLLWLYTYRFRSIRGREVHRSRLASVGGVENAQEQDANEGNEGNKTPITDGSGLGIGSYVWLQSQKRNGLQTSAISTLLEGYYDHVPWAVRAAFAGRCTAVTILSYALYHRYWRT
ncbi:MAG: hypothetical protein M1831_007045 [Alyxoria varia]|nr:MAG: hypothetical protein M1831_007045 [Alyxoria varia]